MTVTNLIDNVKFEVNTKNTDYTTKNCSCDSNDLFSNIFESANKSVDFSFDKTNEKYDENTKKYDYNEKQEFKSEYENFYNNKNFNDSRNDYSNKTASDNNHTVDKEKNETSSFDSDEIKNSEQKDAVISEKTEDKTVSEEKNAKKEEPVTEESTKEKIADKENNSKNINKTTNAPTGNETTGTEKATIEKSVPVVQVASAQADLNKKSEDAQPQGNNKTQTNLPEESKSAQKQTLNEKTTNKQSETSSTEAVKDKTIGETKETKEIKEIKEIKENKENKNEINTKQTDQPTKQTAETKPEFLASENVLNKLKALDKNLTGKISEEKSKSSSKKLNEVLEKTNDKPVITNIESGTDSSKTNFDNLKQQQEQQAFKLAVNQTQTVSAESAGQKSEGVQQNVQFDKILNAKQSDNLQSSVLNQVKEKISAETAGNKSQINIALKPENLGRVNIKLVSQDGVLTAKIITENNRVKDILNKGIENLRQNMSEQGINVGRIVVNSQESDSLNQNNNREGIFKNFDGENSNMSNMNNPQGKQTRSKETVLNYSGNQLPESEEESEIGGEINDLSAENAEIHSGRVDYKV